MVAGGDVAAEIHLALQALQAGFTERHDRDLDGPAPTPGKTASERKPAAGRSEE